jgi:hypothetical protein
MTMHIEKIDNGYILTGDRGYKSAFPTAEDLFRAMLTRLEGKYAGWGGDSYGTVFVATKPGQQFTAPPEQEPK